MTHFQIPNFYFGSPLEYLNMLLYPKCPLCVGFIKRLHYSLLSRKQYVK